MIILKIINWKKPIKSAVLSMNISRVYLFMFVNITYTISNKRKPPCFCLSPSLFSFFFDWKHGHERYSPLQLRERFVVSRWLMKFLRYTKIYIVLAFNSRWEIIRINLHSIIKPFRILPIPSTILHIGCQTLPWVIVPAYLY